MPLVNVTKIHYDGQCVADPYLCEKCGSDNSYGIALLGAYNATLCNGCRREFEVYIRGFQDFKVWSVSAWQLKTCPKHEESEYFPLYTEAQRNLGEAVMAWFKEGGGEDNISKRIR